MKKIGYGIVGTGYFGAGLARLLANLEGTKIVSIFDPENAEAISKELDCGISNTIDELCSIDEIDAIIVASPNYLHKDPVITAAKYKKHIFCEKPIALSYSDCNEMVNAAKENGVIFMAGHIMNFMNGVRTAKKYINDGAIGELLFCHSCRNGWEEPQETVTWKKIRSKSGGHLYHHIHELDLIQFIMGPAITAHMIGGNVAHKGEKFGDEDDMLFISLEFEGNKFATMQYGSAFHLGDHFVKIQGTKGAILIDLQDTKVIIKSEYGVEKYLLHESKEEDDDRTRIYKGAEMDGAIAYGKPGKTPPMWLNTIMNKEMIYFNNIMHGEKSTEEFASLLDGSAARAAIATADALTISIKENRKVKVSEINN